MLDQPENGQRYGLAGGRMAKRELAGEVVEFLIRVETPRAHCSVVQQLVPHGACAGQRAHGRPFGCDVGQAHQLVAGVRRAPVKPEP